jgi:hypothetical protein
MTAATHDCEVGNLSLFVAIGVNSDGYREFIA